MSSKGPARNPETLLADSASRNRTFMIPDLVSACLDDTIERCRRAGVVVTRSEVIAAQILAAGSSSTEEIDRACRAFRVQTVAAVVQVRGTLSMPPVRPGRRAKVNS